MIDDVRARSDTAFRLLKKYYAKGEFKYGGGNFKRWTSTFERADRAALFTRYDRQRSWGDRVLTEPERGKKSISDYLKANPAAEEKELFRKTQEVRRMNR